MARHGSNLEAREEENQKHINKSVWDCGSNLYDSFELYTFSQQLRRALSGKSPSVFEDGTFRSLSMPHYVSTHAQQEKEEKDVHVSVQNLQLQQRNPKPRRNILGMGIPRSLERIFTRVFFFKGKTNNRIKKSSRGATVANCF